MAWAIGEDMAIGTKEAYDLLRILARDTRRSTISTGIASHKEVIQVNEFLSFLYFLCDKPNQDNLSHWIDIYLGLHKEAEDYHSYG